MPERRYLDTWQASHPLASSKGAVKTHRKVLYDAIGPGTHPCHWCGTPVTWVARGGTQAGNLVVDHLDGDTHHNERSNLVPSCHRCNTGRAVAIGEGELFLIRAHDRVRAVERVCQFCGRTFLIAPAHVRQGGGRFCSHSCCAKNRWARAKAV